MPFQAPDRLQGRPVREQRAGADGRNRCGRRTQREIHADARGVAVRRGSLFLCKPAVGLKNIAHDLHCMNVRARDSNLFNLNAAAKDDQNTQEQRCSPCVRNPDSFWQSLACTHLEDLALNFWHHLVGGQSVPRPVQDIVPAPGRNLASFSGDVSSALCPRASS